MARPPGPLPERPADWERPAYRHVPGRNARPSGGVVEHWAQGVSKAGIFEDPLVAQAWQYALCLVDEEFYWESHEVLEQIWLKAPPNSQERMVVQGMIHLANAALKLKMARPNATARLAALARRCFLEASLGRKVRVLGFDCGAAATAASAFSDLAGTSGKQHQVLSDLVRSYEI